MSSLDRITPVQLQTFDFHCSTHEQPSTSAALGIVALAGTTTPALAHSQRTGALTANTTMNVAVSLKLRNEPQLQAFLAAVSDPHSIKYGHYLTTGQFQAEYGPTRASVDAVPAYLRSQSLQVKHVSGNRQVIDATASASQAATAFGTSLGDYTDRADGEHYYANDATVTLRASVSALIQGVSGLNDHTVRHTDYSAKPGKAPKNRHDSSNGFGPSDYDGAYNLDKLGNGSGETATLFEFDAYAASDLQTYDSTYGISEPAPTTVSVDGANYDSKPGDGDGEGEVELDSEIVTGVGGTSAAAPLWSGFTALYNQDAAGSGAPNLGQANPALYHVTDSPSYGWAFHDVTTGGNQDFKAGQGYDQVTGLGSPVADGLASALLANASGSSGS